MPAERAAAVDAPRRMRSSVGIQAERLKPAVVRQTGRQPKAKKTTGHKKECTEEREPVLQLGLGGIRIGSGRSSIDGDSDLDDDPDLDRNSPDRAAGGQRSRVIPGRKKGNAASAALPGRQRRHRDSQRPSESANPPSHRPTRASIRARTDTRTLARDSPRQEQSTSTVAGSSSPSPSPTDPRLLMEMRHQKVKEKRSKRIRDAQQQSPKPSAPLPSGSGGKLAKGPRKRNPTLSSQAPPLPPAHCRRMTSSSSSRSFNAGGKSSGRGCAEEDAQQCWYPG